MDYKEAIELGLAASASHVDIARKVYLTYPTSVFVGNEELQFEIFNKISQFFNIPITSVQVVGSAKTGHSYYKNQGFIKGVSDLDIAIVDSSLFVQYVDKVFQITKGFSDRTAFQRFQDGSSSFHSYKEYLSKGIFRPDLMPSGVLKGEWRSFFGKLSSQYSETFKSINAGIYLSQTFFEQKQKQSIKDYINNKAELND